LPLAAEVGAEPGPQVAGATDVEHLALATEEEIDAGAGRRAEREVPLVEQPPCSRGRQGRKVRDRARAALLREPDQCEQQLGGRARVGQRAVTRLLGGVEEPGELGEPEARDAPREEPAGEPHRVDDRRPDARAGQQLGLAIEEGEVEARVVGDEDRVAREGEEAPHRFGRAGRPAQVLVPQAGHGARPRGDRKARVDQRLELPDHLEAAQANRPDLADPGPAGPQAGRLEVDDDVRRVLEEERRAGRLGQPDRVPVPREPGVGLHHLRQQRAGERDRRVSQGEEPARCLVREHRPAVLLDELHQAIGGV
jgi:hypothetical protein